MTLLPVFDSWRSRGLTELVPLAIALDLMNKLPAGGIWTLARTLSCALMLAQSTRATGEARMASKLLEIVDSSGLIDAIWSEISKLQSAYRNGGERGLATATAKLAKNPIRYVRVVGAFFPDEVREAIRNEMAEIGLTEDDFERLSANSILAPCTINRLSAPSCWA